MRSSGCYRGPGRFTCLVALAKNKTDGDIGFDGKNADSMELRIRNNKLESFFNSGILSSRFHAQPARLTYDVLAQADIVFLFAVDFHRISVLLNTSGASVVFSSVRATSRKESVWLYQWNMASRHFYPEACSVNDV